MDLRQTTSFFLIPQGEWENFKKTQLQILEELKNIQEKHRRSSTPQAGYLTAVEFMRAVSICRSKFDQLASSNKIRVIKKKRKIYVPLSEVDRYFADPAIQ